MEGLQEAVMYSEKETEQLKAKIEELTEKTEYLENHVEYLQDEVKAMKNSLSWKITAPIRMLLLRCKPLKSVFKFIKSIFKSGIKDTIQIYGEKRDKHIQAKAFLLTEKEAGQQRQHVFEKQHQFLIIAAIDDKAAGNEQSRQQVKEFVSSVSRQTYERWQLLLLADTKEDLEEVQGMLAGQENKAGKLKCALKTEDRWKKEVSSDYLLFCNTGVLLQESLLFEIMAETQAEEKEVIYTDSVVIKDSVKNITGHQFRPDYSPHMLENYNYIGNVFCVKRECLDGMEEDTKRFKDAYSYDLLLKLSERAAFAHIPKVLYYNREEIETADAVQNIMQEEKEALRQHFARKGRGVEVTDGELPCTYHLQYKIDGSPKVSIMIPTCDHVQDLQLCITSILEKSTYSNYEIIVIENNSKEEETFAYYKTLENIKNIKVIYWEGGFNYSAINNFGEKHADGSYLLLLNNDIEVITPSWIEEMLMYAQMEDVGAVGVKLFFPDDTIQHAGVILGIRGLAGHGHRGFRRDADGYMNRLKIVQDYSIVTAACLMIERKKFTQIKGFDEELAVDYNDVDLCMKLIRQGYYNVFTPYAQMYHYESKSRGSNVTKEKLARVEKEFYHFNIRWNRQIKGGDPYYNKNLTLHEDDFSIGTNQEE